MNTDVEKSNDIFLKNFNVVMQRWPDVAEALHFFQSRITVSLNASRDAWLWNDHVSGDSGVLALTDFDKELQGSMDTSRIKKSCMVVADGFGSGQHIQLYVQKNNPRLQRLLIIEKDPRKFFAALQISDLTSLLLDGRMEIIFSLEDLEMSSSLRRYLLSNENLMYIGKVGRLPHLLSLQSDQKYYIGNVHAFQKTVDELCDILQAPGEDNYRGLLNITRNMKKLEEALHIAELPPFLSGKPVVVVSAGPSLSLHIQHIKKNRSKFFLAAVDGALSTLLNHAIKPDLLFCFERGVATGWLFNDLPLDSQIPLVAMPLAHPSILYNHPGPLLIATRDASFGKWLYPEFPLLFMGTNIAVMAYQVLTFWGAGAVYLLGQDLAYERGSLKSHVEGINEEVKKFTEEQAKTDESVDVIGNNGEMIRTNVYWQLAIANFKFAIMETRVPCFNIIPKDKGALLPGMQRLDPQKFWGDEINSWGNPPRIDLVLSALKNRNPIKFDARIDDTIKVLKSWSENLLQIMKDISLTYHEHAPIRSDDQMRNFYEKKFSEWEYSFKATFSRNWEIYDSFLYCLTMSGYVRRMIAIYSLDPSEEIFKEYVLKKVSLWQEILQEVFTWCKRCEELLVSSVNIQQGECENSLFS